MIYLLIDSNQLAYRALHTMGDLSAYEKKTGVIFGFLNQVLQLGKKFNRTEIKFVFCWDSRKSLRQMIYPEYKQNRHKDLSEQEREDLNDAYRQFDLLRKEILPGLGFNNVLMEIGFESDDLLAQLSMDLYQEAKENFPHEMGFDFFIVSNDNDLYQLLDYCRIYNISKKKFYQKGNLFQEYGIIPKEWIDIKSLAGCQTDNVKGIEGVGIVKAIQYLKNELPNGKIYDRILENLELVEFNKKFIKLPFQSLDIELKDDEFSIEKLDTWFSRYDMKSFIQKNKFDEWKGILGI